MPIIYFQTLNPFMGDLNENPPLSANDAIYLTDLEPVSAAPDWLNEKVDVKKYLGIGLNQLDNKFYNKPDSPYACLSDRYPGKGKMYSCS